MSLIADIRAQMARESGPVHPKHLAEVLDQDLTTVRNTMNQANTKGYGIERLDDGTFSLIPGWKPGRGPNAAAEPTADTPAAKTAAVPPKDQAPRSTSKKAIAKPKRAYVRKAAEAKPSKAKNAAKPKRAYVRRARTPAQPVSALSRPALKADQEHVFVSRTSLALLVEGVLDGNAPITGALRTALREATSHAPPF